MYILYLFLGIVSVVCTYVVRGFVRKRSRRRSAGFYIHLPLFASTLCAVCICGIVAAALAHGETLAAAFKIVVWILGSVLSGILIGAALYHWFGESVATQYETSRDQTKPSA